MLHLLLFLVLKLLGDTRLQVKTTGVVAFFVFTLPLGLQNLSLPSHLVTLVQKRRTLSILDTILDDSADLSHTVM